MGRRRDGGMAARGAGVRANPTFTIPYEQTTYVFAPARPAH
jgi:hypothetical protein